MAVRAELTPNPNAMKFTVGRPIGGPATYVAAGDHHNPLADALLGVEGVASVFMVSDFVTITKTADSQWSEIESEVLEILGEHFG